MTGPARGGLAALLLLATAAHAAGAESYRWRLSVEGAKAHLFAAEDDATDFTGTFSLRCQQGAGDIEVGVTIGSDEEKAFSRIIADDIYPAVKFRGVPDDRFFALIERITFGELGAGSSTSGWPRTRPRWTRSRRPAGSPCPSAGSIRPSSP